MLTVLVGLVMSPVVTLMFGVALLPFSWPYLAAVPILLGTAVALSQGGVGQAWWRRLPPARTAAWVIATFGVLSLASALMTHLDTPGIVAVAGLAGIVDARAWYGLTAAAVARGGGKAAPPVAVAGRAVADPAGSAAPDQLGAGGAAGGGDGARPGRGAGPAGFHRDRPLRLGRQRRGGRRVTGDSGDDGRAAAAWALAIPVPPAPNGREERPAVKISGALLVVAGFGSTCCHSANALRAAEPNMLVRQFSYLGLNAAGQPIPYGRAGDLPIQVLGDRMAAQVDKLYQQARTPVDIVAESEGTLGLYAMLARHPHVPIGSVVLLSPIVEPGQAARRSTPCPAPR